MPASLKDLRARIKSVKSTQQITKAMKLVSTAKFGKAQGAVLQARPYTKSLLELTNNLAFSDGVEHPFLAQQQGVSSLVVVLSSERGLCGGFNNNVVKIAWKAFLQNSQNGISTNFLLIGKKSFPLLSRLRKTVGLKSKIKIIDWSVLTNKPEILFENSETLYCVTGYFDKPNLNKALFLSEMIQKAYLNKHLNSVTFAYNQFQSALTQVSVVEKILPMLPEKGENTFRIENSSLILEPSINEIINVLIPKALQTKIFQILLESIASEHGARMTAMESATRNAKDMEKKLQLLYQRARQAAITKELVEIISGAQAL